MNVSLSYLLHFFIPNKENIFFISDCPEIQDMFPVRRKHDCEEKIFGTLLYCCLSKKRTISIRKMASSLQTNLTQHVGKKQFDEVREIPLKSIEFYWMVEEGHTNVSWIATNVNELQKTKVCCFTSRIFFAQNFSLHLLNKWIKFALGFTFCSSSPGSLIVYIILFIHIRLAEMVCWNHSF